MCMRPIKKLDETRIKFIVGPKSNHRRTKKVRTDTLLIDGQKQDEIQ